MFSIVKPDLHARRVASAALLVLVLALSGCTTASQPAATSAPAAPAAKPTEPAKAAATSAPAAAKPTEAAKPAAGAKPAGTGAAPADQGACTDANATKPRPSGRGRFVIGTGGTGGVYFPFGGGLARILTAHLPNTEWTAE